MKQQHHKIRHILEQRHKKTLEKFYKKHGETIKQAKRSAVTLAGAAVIAAGTLTNGQTTLNKDHVKVQQQQSHKETVNAYKYVHLLKELLTTKTKLNKDEEKVIARALSNYFRIDVREELEGNRLNEIYGYVGAEQHLYRWKGDTLAQHTVQKAGMAPLQGAFKNFDTAEQEKYYVAVQLHELPNWDKDWVTLKPWYRYRKVMVYNPKNNKAIIAVIGDAGPSKWTGKTFGGSPEVMDYLNMVDGSKKGKAIILFVNDPHDKIPLGPLSSI